MSELEIGLVESGELNFDSFLRSNVEKKIYAKSYLKEHYQFD